MNIVSIVLAVVTVAMASGQTPAKSVATAEALIRQSDAAMANAVEAKSVDQLVAFYDAEAVAGSGMPPVQGLTGIRAMWTKFLGQPCFSLTWKADKVMVISSGELGYSTGSWRDGKKTGPYLIVWRKKDGQWKALFDSAWNSHSPEEAARTGLAPLHTAPEVEVPRTPIPDDPDCPYPDCPF
jgi:ketosteroid isomerase-like protein